MAFLLLVVERRAAMHQFGQLAGPERLLARQTVDLLDQVEEKAAVAVGHRAQRGVAVIGQWHCMAEMLLGADQQGFERAIVEPAQHEDLGAR